MGGKMVRTVTDANYFYNL